MQHCPLCNVNIAGARTVCTRCRCRLTDEPDLSLEVFPPSCLDKNFLPFLVRIFTFACIVSAVVAVIINVQFPSGGWWCLFALFGILCAWTVTFVALRKKHNVLKNILWQLVIVAGFAMLWDRFTGQRGWSVDYVIPCLLICALIALFVLARARREPPRSSLV